MKYLNKRNLKTNFIINNSLIHIRIINNMNNRIEIIIMRHIIQITTDLVVWVVVA